MLQAANTDQAPASPAPRSADTSTTRRPQKTKVCKYWEKGSCKYGTQCRFAHGADNDACSAASTIFEDPELLVTELDVLVDNMALMYPGPSAGAPAVQRGPRNPPSSNRMQGNGGGGRGGPFRGGGVTTEGRSFRDKVGVAVLCGKYLADDVVSRFPMDEGTFPCAFPCNNTVCHKDHIYPERYGVREGKGREADALVSVPLKALGALALDENDPKHAQVCVPMRQLLCCCCPYRCLPNAPFPHLSHATPFPRPSWDRY